jgi:hypothetical protein
VRLQDKWRSANRKRKAACALVAAPLAAYGDEKAANRDIRVWHGATEKWSLNDGQIQKTLQPIWDRAAI